ncbi:class I SAM-dependent methyltransferase [Pedobacter sp. KR3-3]|uniref:Class I SAM-dependent methyltransferase n=1 Tax=Pedobacter albus TaxID=3113905 RepID=A0ABU7I9I8_9SPHI|nr:class I SAM-dependent methyltransferase [Pedobacter sp. KR3-3]MEE1946024.1 class I SAM-dependent methyltransferase [Pedobacter sp. KR3-3]
MAKREPSYDKIAKRYDFLSRLVFFKSQVKAQTEQLGYIRHCKKLLIVGGGTGWILKDLNAITQPMTIVFVEAAIEMIALAKKVVTHHQVEFVHQDIEDYQTNQVFDAVLTPFLFDNFDGAKAEKVFGHIDALLAAEGIWVDVDFYLNKQSALWKRAILKAMHLFFRFINVVRVNDLIDTSPFFKPQYIPITEKHYYGNFIKAVIYQKQP